MKKHRESGALFVEKTNCKKGGDAQPKIKNFGFPFLLLTGGANGGEVRTHAPLRLKNACFFK